MGGRLEGNSYNPYTPSHTVRSSSYLSNVNRNLPPSKTTPSGATRKLDLGIGPQLSREGVCNLKNSKKRGGLLATYIFYKCISRAFATRLKKYMNKLTPCCQKGYANGRYCQEVLISVIDTIEKCRHLNKKGGVLCLDIKKAFDSLSHSYLKNIFEFYNHFYRKMNTNETDVLQIAIHSADRFPDESDKTGFYSNQTLYTILSDPIDSQPAQNFTPSWLPPDQITVDIYISSPVEAEEASPVLWRGDHVLSKSFQMSRLGLSSEASFQSFL